MLVWFVNFSGNFLELFWPIFRFYWSSVRLKGPLNRLTLSAFLLHFCGFCNSWNSRILSELQSVQMVPRLIWNILQIIKSQKYTGYSILNALCSIIYTVATVGKALIISRNGPVARKMFSMKIYHKLYMISDMNYLSTVK